MFILPWYVFDAGVSSRTGRKDEPTFILEIFARIYFALYRRREWQARRRGAARCRRTNDLMREGLETPDSSSQPGNERGKKGHAWRPKVREGRRIYGLCKDRPHEPSDAAKYQWNFECGEEGNFSGHDSLSPYLAITPPITSCAAIKQCFIRDFLFAYS